MEKPKPNLTPITDRLKETTPKPLTNNINQVETEKLIADRFQPVEKPVTVYQA